MTDILKIVRLLPTYDPKALQADLVRLGGARFNPQATYTEGTIVKDQFQGWSVISLRSPGGRPERTDAGGPGLLDYDNTPYLAEAPSVAKLLNELGVRLRAVRLMSLEPNASVSEHQDYPYGPQVGWVRLHVPIVTNPQAAIVLDGTTTNWQPGELWYADFGRPHHLYNKGSRPRVHLVIDCYCGPGLLELFPPEARTALAQSDIMLRRPEVPVSTADLHHLAGPLTVPAKFLQSYLDPPSPETFAALDEPDLKGVLRCEDGGLILSIEGGRETRLEHIGEREFRERCWTEERTIKFLVRGGTEHALFRNRRGTSHVEVVRSVPRC